MNQEQDENQRQEPTAANPAEAAIEETVGDELLSGEEDRAAEMEAELADAHTKLQYAQAEIENVRRRLEQQAADRAKYAVANFAKDMLTVADNLRRALDSVPASARDGNEVLQSLTMGVEMTERELLGALERYGIKPVPALGQRFDPHLHQAMMEVEEPSQPSGTVVLVMQGGYTIHDRLLRPAMVGVSKGGPKPAPEDKSELPPEAPPGGDAAGRVDTRV